MVVLVLLVVPQLVLNDPGRRYEAEAADGHQSRGEQHPEATHTAEHGGSLGQKARKETQIDPEPDFFLLPAQERMHLELTPSRAVLQLGQVRRGCAVCVQSMWKSCKKWPKTHQQGERLFKSYALFPLHCSQTNARIFRQTGSADQAGRDQSRWGSWRFSESCGHQHVPEPPASSCAPLSLLSLAQLLLLGLSEARLHSVEIASVKWILPDYFRGFSKLIVKLEAWKDGIHQSQSVLLVQSTL